MNYKPGEATLFDSTSFGFTGQAILRDALPNDPLNTAHCVPDHSGIFKQKPFEMVCFSIFIQNNYV